jgi:hypothetical protein
LESVCLGRAATAGGALIVFAGYKEKNKIAEELKEELLRTHTYINSSSNNYDE